MLLISDTDSMINFLTELSSLKKFFKTHSIMNH